MNLHNNANDFSALVTFTAAHFNITAAFVEKDYWITLILNRLSRSVYADTIVFKGGTSLSKGYRLINRFSEDIDIATIDENISGNALKRKIRAIEKDITTDFKEIEEPNITSKGSMFRKAIFEYPTILTGPISKDIPNRIIVEINSFANPYPFVKQEITSFIAEFLVANNQLEYIEQYDLQSFYLNILDKRRTLIEKLVSLIRFSYADNPLSALSSKIRHFYDLYLLVQDKECAEYIQSVNFKTDFADLLTHDKEMFDTPENWRSQNIEDSPLVNNFPALWENLRSTYQNELLQLAFTSIPAPKEIQITFSQLLKYI